jgi:hypothetical protein
MFTIFLRNYPVWVAYLSFLFVEECNSACPIGFSIFVEAPVRCSPQNIAVHSNVQWPHCMMVSE